MTTIVEFPFGPDALIFNGMFSGVLVVLIAIGLVEIIRRVL